MRRRRTGWAEANAKELSVKRPGRGRGHNLSVRFWIITMMLVLFGVSNLKLR